MAHARSLIASVSIDKTNPPRSPLIRGEANHSDLEQCAPSPDKGRAGEGFRAATTNIFDAPFIPYNKNLRELARQNRKNPTSAEIKIWNELLRNKSFANHKFTRQKPLGGYIADFYCAELRLVVEIDGDSHAKNVEYDIERTKFLETLGLTVIRYQNRDIFDNLAGVATDLQERIAAISQQGSSKL